MKKIHAQEKEQFKKLLHQEGAVEIDKRFQVFEAFLMTENHVTVPELVSFLADRNVRVDPDFVSDTLQFMVHYGFAEKKRFDDGKNRFEHRHIGIHHDHMICTKCREIMEFTDDRLEKLQLKIAGKHGFHMLLHKMEIYGICSECMSGQDERLPLDLAKPGDRLIIKEYTGGKNFTMRLVSMGLRIGDTIEVLTNSGKGQVVVAAGFSRYMLGRGMSQKILVAHSKPERL
ncbi:MAG: transcriptional repressor [Pseudomonadota bacterium]